MKIGSTSLRQCERSVAIHKRGFTLMELMVYMGIVGIVVVIAGEAFSNSTKFRIRTDNMIKATQEAENVAMLFKEDVEQLGAKNSREAGIADAGTLYGVKFGGVKSDVYMDPGNPDLQKRDSSSFILETTDGFSDLKFRRIRYDTSGYYQAVEEIRWYVDITDSSLKRTCKIISKATSFTLPTSDPCVEGSDLVPVEMATHIKTFTVEAANPGVKIDESQLFPPDDLTEFRLVPRVGDNGFASFKSANTVSGSESNGGTSITLSDFFSNYVNSTESYLSGASVLANQAVAIKNETSSELWNVLCNNYGKMTLSPDTVYEISFSLGDRGLRFVPGVDHMSVGFRKAGSGDYARKNGNILLDDFLFFPPMDTSGRGAGKRTMRFTVPERIDNVCLAFTFVCFTPLASTSRVTIKDLRITQVATTSYKFNGFYPESAVNKKEKKNVKALKLKLQVSRGAKNGGKGETGDVDLVVAIPSNGPRD